MAPFEHERETSAAPPTVSHNGRAGAAAETVAGRAFTTRVRTRWYRVRIALYQLPNLPDPASVNQSGNSSGFGGIGSPTRIRTSNLPVNSRPLYR